MQVIDKFRFCLLAFLDHLQFGYIFCAIHMPQHSPLPMFLHSIMGVGTNLFPMQLEQQDRLASFLSQDELDHISVFPTALRLINGGMLLDRLEKMSNEELLEIDEFTCCRVIGPVSELSLASFV